VGRQHTLPFPEPEVERVSPGLGACVLLSSGPSLWFLRRSLPLNLAFQMALSFMRRRNSRLPSFTAIVSVLGVSFGVAAFLVVVTVFNSFENQLRHILLAANPNLVVFKLPAGIPYADKYREELAKLISKPYQSIALFEYNEVVLSKGDRTAAVVLRGIQGEESASGPDLARTIQPAGALATLNDDVSVFRSLSTRETDLPAEDSPAAAGASPLPSMNSSALKLPSLILGKGLALKLDAKVGDVVTFASNALSGGRQSKLQRFTVTGLLSVGLAQYDEKLTLVNFYDAAHLFGEPGFAKGIEVRFKDPTDALAVSQELAPRIPYSVRAWQEIDRGLFEQIDRDGTAIKVIVLIITFVAGFNIIVTLSLSVIDRARQISLLRALGARRGFIVRVFVFMGAVLGFVGALCGVLLGLAILRVFSGFELGELQAYYFLERIPVEYDPALILGAFGVAFLLSFLSALYPAWRATLVSPLNGLKPGAR
jgi:lipoprotein-releasing system permease protein